MASAVQVGVVCPSHGVVRRLLLPIYAVDQLVCFALAALPIAWLATVDSNLALYMGVGGYIGAMLTMQRSTPSSLLLDHRDKPAVIRLLDSSPFMKRTSNEGEWISVRGRLRRWSTDTIRLRDTSAGLLVTGRLIDLEIMAHQLAS